MQKPQPITQPTDSRIRPLSDYSDRIEIKGEVMTEYEWLTCEDDSKMLRFLGEEFWSQKYSSIHFKQHLFDRKHSCDLIREVVGNPFYAILVGEPEMGLTSINLAPGAAKVDWFLPEWLTGDVYYFAANIVKSGDYQDVDVLADLLEEAGCDNEELLRHFRQEVKCPECKGTGHYWKKSPGPGPFRCTVCKGTGWIPKPVPCQDGCWAFRLLTGG